MRWQDTVDTSYTRAHMKALLILQRRGIRFLSEVPFPLYRDERGFPHGIIADIYLPDSLLRIECDSEYFHRNRRGKENRMDKLLLEKHGIHTVRLDNHALLLASGEQLLMEAIQQ